jgi:hypothetical protein
MSERPALKLRAGRQHGIQVRPNPVAVFALFVMALSELTNGRAGLPPG